MIFSRSSAVLLAALAVSCRSAEGPRTGDRSAAAQVAQSPAPATSPSLSMGSALEEQDRLGRALAAVRTRDLSADVDFLADAVLAGRDTPSSGLRVAARYIACRLERLGLRPGVREGSEASFFHSYPLLHDRVDEERTFLRLERDGRETTFALGTDYAFPGYQIADLVAVGDVVDCAAGVKGDFSSRELSGRWALAHGAEESWLRRALFARRAGAQGLLVAPLPGEETQDRVRDWAAVARKGKVRWFVESLKPRTVFPIVLLTPEAAEAIAGDSSPAPDGTLGVRLTHGRGLPGAQGRIDVENVCALWPGRDPELAGEVVLVAAHYDHVGVRKGEVYPGADDNASGSVALLAVAEALATYGPLDRTVALLWVSGEEKGLLGSRAWSERPELPEGLTVVAAISMDMVARNAPEFMTLTPSREHEAYNALSRSAERLAPTEGFAPLVSGDIAWSRSDHYAFHTSLGVPVIGLSSDEHEDYHRPSDTADKLDFDKLRRLTRLVVRMLADYGHPPRSAAWAAASRAMGTR